METEFSDPGPERPSLTVVGTVDDPVPSPRRRRAPNRTKANISKSQTLSETVKFVAARSNDVASLTVEELEGYRRSLIEFRTVLQELVSGSTAGSEVVREPLRLTRNPYAKLRRYFDQEPGFEELVGKYASLLPLLERPPGMIYSEIGLIGIEALRARRLAISEHVYEEVRFRTSTSAALAMVMKGVALFIGIFLLLSVILPSVSLTYAKWTGGISTEQITDFVTGYLNPLKNVGTAIFFGCIGSVVSLLLRIGEFEGANVRSKAFLLLYGLTLPIVGGIFAAVLSALLDLGTIKIAGNSTQTYIIVGFLSGFSERFTRNILDFAEDRIYPKARDMIKIEDRAKAFEKRTV
jgi:hypothetical protein